MKKVLLINGSPHEKGNTYFALNEAAKTLNESGFITEIVWIGTDGTQIGIHGGIGWSKVPRTPVIKSLELNVEGTQLRINYEAEARD